MYVGAPSLFAADWAIYRQSRTGVKPFSRKRVPAKGDIIAVAKK
jgi:hypothetical protein